MSAIRRIADSKRTSLQVRKVPISEVVEIIRIMGQERAAILKHRGRGLGAPTIHSDVGCVERPPRGGLSHINAMSRVASVLQQIDQLFEALLAQARDAAAIGTTSPTSTTGTTLTSFQKLYFETNVTMTLWSLASAST